MNHLIAAGCEVTGYARRTEVRDTFVAEGGHPAESIAQAANGADVFITMLPDSPDVEEVVLGAGGLLDNAAPGLLYIDMSTIRPDTAKAVASECQARGVRAIDAPVSGGERGAIDATLSIMVGGRDEDVEAARPILEAMGTTVVHLGPNGSGQTVKAANQLIVGGIYELVAEAIVFLETHGVDTEAAMDVLKGGLAGSRILDLKAASMLNREFTPGFRIDLHHKDMGIVTQAAREAGVILPLGSIVAELIASASAQGDGALDHSALLRGVERLSGRFAS